MRVGHALCFSFDVGPPYLPMTVQSKALWTEFKKTTMVLELTGRARCVKRMPETEGGAPSPVKSSGADWVC